MERDIELRLKGKVVSKCCVDAVFSLEFLETNQRTVIRIGGRMDIVDRTGRRFTLSGRSQTEAGQACSLLFGKRVEDAIGRKDGTLDIRFTDGDSFVVPVDPNYEAWELSSTDGFMVVSLPGGELANWKPRQASSGLTDSD